MSTHNNSPSTRPTAFAETSYKKVEDELKDQGMKIKHHEDNVDYLKDVARKLDDEIVDCNIALGKALSKSSEDAIPGDSEDVIIKSILKYEKSAAAIFCQMKYGSGMSDLSLIEDVIGVVAMLGATHDPRLSSILSEYLGLDNMLSVVCKTSKGAKALKSYNKDGSIDKTTGLYAFAADVMGISLDERFRVICLDDLRPYPGSFIDADPHSRLKLVKPVLNGDTLPGFLGFAVNMVFIDSTKMYCMSKAGNTLRETLFYDLFSSLQVYRTRNDMLRAKPFISNGAVSLDGGMIERNGVVVPGPQKTDIGVKFPVRPRGSVRPEEYYEIEERIKEKTWTKRLTLEDLQIEQELVDRAKDTYEVKKKEFVNVLTSGSLYVTQVGRASTRH